MTPKDLIMKHIQAYAESEGLSFEDATAEIRPGECGTGIQAPSHHIYDCMSVASCIDGQWVGWNYWHGGGKYMPACMVPWIDDAYFLDCEEKEVVEIKRAFKKVETK